MDSNLRKKWNDFFLFKRLVNIVRVKYLGNKKIKMGRIFIIWCVLYLNLF